MDAPLRSVEDDPTQVRAVSRADDIKVDGSGLRKLGSIDHGACLVIGVGAIGVEVEYRTGGNGAPGTIAIRPISVAATIGARMPAAEPARPTPTDLRARLRRPGDALPDASIGTVPILWHHADPDGRPVAADPITILDEIARLGYEGTQLDDGLPEGSELRSLLARHDLGLAEVYAALPASPTGLGPDALAIGRERLRLLVEGTGDILCVASMEHRIATRARVGPTATARHTCPMPRGRSWPTSCTRSPTRPTRRGVAWRSTRTPGHTSRHRPRSNASWRPPIRRGSASASTSGITSWAVAILSRPSTGSASVSRTSISRTSTRPCSPGCRTAPCPAWARPSTSASSPSSARACST